MVKLIDGIKLDDGGKYNLAKVLIDSNNSDAFVLPNDEELHTKTKVTTVVHQSIATRNFNILDKFFIFCMGSKLTCVVRQIKSMIVTRKKMKEVCINF